MKTKVLQIGLAAGLFSSVAMGAPQAKPEVPIFECYFHVSYDETMGRAALYKGSPECGLRADDANAPNLANQYFQQSAVDVYMEPDSVRCQLAGQKNQETGEYLDGLTKDTVNLLPFVQALSAYTPNEPEQEKNQKRELFGQIYAYSDLGWFSAEVDNVSCSGVFVTEVDPVAHSGAIMKVAALAGFSAGVFGFTPWNDFVWGGLSYATHPWDIPGALLNNWRPHQNKFIPAAIVTALTVAGGYFGLKYMRKPRVRTVHLETPEDVRPARTEGEPVYLRRVYDRGAELLSTVRERMPSWRRSGGESTPDVTVPPSSGPIHSSGLAPYHSTAGTHSGGMTAAAPSELFSYDPHEP